MYAWSCRIDPSERPQKAGLSSFNLYVEDVFDSVSSRLGTTEMKVVAPEIGKLWHSLSEEEKRGYKEKMIEINKQRAKAKQEDNEGESANEINHCGEA